MDGNLAMANGFVNANEHDGEKEIMSIKDQLAIEKGYASWDDLYDFTCREGQRPDVVGQLIESYVEQAILKRIALLESGSFSGWSDDSKNGYLTALTSLKREIK